MASAMGKFPVGTPREHEKEVVVVAAQSDGSCVASYPSKRVRSVQPDGSVATRDEGTAGDYERFYVNGGIATYCPDKVHVYDFVYDPKVPNA